MAAQCLSVTRAASAFWFTRWRLLDGLSVSSSALPWVGWWHCVIRIETRQTTPSRGCGRECSRRLLV